MSHSSLAALVAASMVAFGCSNAPPPAAGLYVADTSGLADTGTGFDAGGNLPGDASATLADAEIDPCACGVLKCGQAPGCDVDCGDKCGVDKLCKDNQCVADPACECHAGQCGTPAGCKTACPGCGPKQQCVQNSCMPTCSCAGIECGIPQEGCAMSCGDCGPGLLCAKNQCVGDPACECKAGQCGVLPGCAATCGACPGGLGCTANKCETVVSECDCGPLKCGPKKPECALSCGLCAVNQFCEAHSCVTYSKDDKFKFGEPCGAGEKCPQPPANAGVTETKKFLNCLNTLCATSICLEGFCSKTCKIGADTKDNASGNAGADGIEDQGVASECEGAVDGPTGAAFRCIEENTTFQVQQGSTLALCKAGDKFQLCQRNADCAKGEACRIYTVQGSVVSRCGPKIHDPTGVMSAAGSAPCNLNSENGAVHLCANNLCSWKGCIDLCKADADCETLPGQCQAGTCTSTGFPCASQADCPKWKCKPGVKLQPLDDTEFSACQPG